MGYISLHFSLCQPNVKAQKAQVSHPVARAQVQDCLGAKLLLIHFPLHFRVSHISSLRFIVIPATELVNRLFRFRKTLQRWPRKLFPTRTAASLPTPTTPTPRPKNRGRASAVAVVGSRRRTTKHLRR